MNFTFCQFNTDFLYQKNKHSLADKYYNQIWKAKKSDGYRKPSEFWEIPLWIVQIDGLLSTQPDFFRSSLYVINDYQDFDLSGFSTSYFLFSVLDINKEHVKKIIRQNPAKDFILGGYVNSAEFMEFDNVQWHESINDFAMGWGIKSKYEISYRLFQDIDCIPRLTLSTGCKHNCKFCTVENDLIEISKENIYKQLDAMQDLCFQLVYVNDKTFGQAKNHTILKDCYKYIKQYNPYFKGFIVQTTAQKTSTNKFCNFLSDAGVFACEIGVESWNDRILKKYRKPHNEKMIKRSIDNLHTNNIKIIPNIIIGLLGESMFTYQKTINELNRYKKHIYMLNIYNLAVYEGTDLYQEIPSTDTDRNENTTQKSFYSDKDTNNIHYFYNAIFNLGLEVL